MRIPSNLVLVLLIGMVFTTGLLVWAVCGRHVPVGERRPIDYMTLARLAQAVHIYYMEYGALPSPTEYKTKLREHNIVEDETVFYSAPSGAEIRYFTSGNRFVLISPGPNGRYDTPVGYEAVEGARETGDDLLKFGSEGN